MEKINWKLKVNESFALAQNEGDNKNLIEVEASENKSNVTNTNSSINPSKVTKLDSNTPTYSNKPGERLDEWLFVMNQAFAVLNIHDGKQKLGLASTYVRGQVLQALIRYTKDNVHSNRDGFTIILKDQFEPRNLDLKIRSQLRSLKQTEGFPKYLKKFQELSNQLPDATERKLFLEFMDGLIDNYKHEVLKNRNCNTVAEAIRIVSDLDFCISPEKKNKVEMNMVKVNNYNSNQNRYKFANKSSFRRINRFSDNNKIKSRYNYNYNNNKYNYKTIKNTDDYSI
ncbi:MAG: hypothetical protein ACOVKJ_04090, partial [Flavobacterium sp.]